MDTYDQLNRIATAQAGTLWGYSYGYDSWGNLTSMTPATGVSNSETSLSISANTSNQLSATGLVLDADGRMTTDNVGNSYTYDAEGQLIQYGDGTNHHFDAAGRLVQEWNGATGVVHSFSYGLNGRREATFDTSGNVVSNVTYAGSQPLMYYTPSSGTYTYEYQNQVGTESARETTGQVTVYTSLPYGDAPGTHLEGSINTTSGSDTDEYHFAGMDVGQSYIPFQQSQIHHAQFRDYYSGSGQWMSPDPYDGSYDITNPQSLNRYAYVSNSPLGFLDPSGLDGYFWSGNCEYYSTYTEGIDPDTGNLEGFYTAQLLTCANDTVSVSVGPPSPIGAPGGAGGGAPNNPQKPQTKQQCLAAVQQQHDNFAVQNAQNAKRDFLVGAGVGAGAVLVAGCAIGAVVTSENGPGAVVGCGAGAVGVTVNGSVPAGAVAGGLIGILYNQGKAFSNEAALTLNKAYCSQFP